MRYFFCFVLLLSSFSAHSVECDDPKTSLEISICLGQELRDSDMKINQSYKYLMEKLSGRDQVTLRDQQRAWIMERDSACYLDTRETNREKWFRELLLDYGKTVCVTKYTRKRTAELDRMLGLTTSRTGITSEFSKTEENTVNNPDVAQDKKSVVQHANGKWYYELFIDYNRVIQIAPIVLVTGVIEGKQLVGTLDNIRMKDAGKDPVTLGIAADLDNGKLYISRNGYWIGGEPGSNKGTDLKTGRNYQGIYAISAENTRLYLDNKALIPNFGDRQMTYALPPGYKIWGEAAQNANLASDEMLELAKKNNCNACHAINNKVIGPSWKGISIKYKFTSQFDYQGKLYPLEEGLMMKVSRGGAGHWGSMPMPANDPSGHKQSDIRELVRFILALTQ